MTTSSYKINMSAVRERKRQMVNDLVEIHLNLFKNSGAELIRGSGSFIGPKLIEVKDADGNVRHVKGEKIILSTGSHSSPSLVPGMQEAKPLTHIEILELDHIPDHLIIVGGGYIGLEFAQALSRFGSKVTIIERNDRLAHREDEDVSEALQNVFKKEGIDFITNATIERVEGVSGESITMHLSKNHFPQTLEGTHLLLAAGRSPNTSHIGLELTGVELTSSGHVKVNDRLETTSPNIWAVGDCCGSPHFTHIAFDDFRIVLENINGGQRVTTGRQVPYCMFTDPELARIGLSEMEAKAQGIPYRLAKIPVSMTLRTRTLSETNGFMKALIDTKTDLILGFTCFGVDGGEIMSAVQIAMLARLPYTTLKNAVFAHPTLVEGLISLFSSVPSIEKPGTLH